MKNGKSIRQKQVADKGKAQTAKSRPVTPDELDHQPRELVRNPLVGNKPKTS